MTPGHAPALLDPLLRRVVAELAQARPVLWVPEQLPCRLDAHRITAVLGVLQLGRNLVVNDYRSDRTLIGRAHRAIRMFAQVSIA